MLANLAIVVACVIIGVAIVLGFMTLAQMRRYRIEEEKNLSFALDAAGMRLSKNHIKEPNSLDVKVSEAGLEMSGAAFYLSLLAAGAAIGIFIDLMIIAANISTTTNLGLLISIPPLGALLAFIFGELFLTMKRKNRMKNLDKQLARALPQIAENLRAGISLEKSLKSVSINAPDPLASELRRVSAEAAFSSDMPEAFRQFAQRTGSNDVLMLATAIKINQARGGNLSNTISSIAKTLDMRQEMRRYCTNAMAATKTTAWLLVGMSILIMLMTAGLNFEQFFEFFSQPVGWLVLGGCALLEALGVFLIYKIGYVEVD